MPVFTSMRNSTEVEAWLHYPATPPPNPDKTLGIKFLIRAEVVRVEGVADS